MNRNRTRTKIPLMAKIFLAGAFCAGVFVLLGRYMRHTDGASSVLSQSGSSVAHRLLFRAGEQRVFHLSLNSSLTVPLLAPAQEHPRVSSRSRIVADLDFLSEVERVDDKGGTLLLGVHRVRAFTLSLLGQEGIESVDEAKERLLNRVARIHITNAGQITLVEYPVEPSWVFSSLVQTVLAETQVRLDPEKPKWTVVESTPLALIRAAYHWTSPPGVSAGTLSKRHGFMERLLVEVGAPPTSVFSEGTMEVGFQDGQAGRINTARTLKLHNTNDELLLDYQVQLQWLQVESAPAARLKPPSETVTRGLNQGIVTEESPEQRLDRRIAGLTPEELFFGLTTFATEIRSAGRDQWFWRSTGLLQKRPELTMQLKDWLEDEPRQPAEQAMVIDLLANAGTDEAQKRMREILKKVSQSNPPMATALLQHAALISHPNADMAAFVAGQYEQQTGQPRLAAAMTLGAVSRRLAESGQAADARQHVSKLADDLGGAREAAEVAALVRALGNSAQPEAMAAIIEHARDSRSSVRAAVAAALRQMHQAEAREVLMTFLKDTSTDVQRESLRTLADHPLSVIDLERIGVQMIDGTLKEGALNQALNLLSRWQAQHPAQVSAILRACLESPLPSGNFRSRIQTLLSPA